MRKIIGKHRFEIVPADPGPNACKCPTVVQIRDIDLFPEIPHSCRDALTQLEFDGIPVTFRYCVCPKSKVCQNLPRTFPTSPLFLDSSSELWQENGRGLYFFPKSNKQTL